MQQKISDPSIRSQIYHEQVAHLYKNAPLSYVFSVLNGFILAFLQRSLISNKVLFTWFSILLVITFLRATLVWSYHRPKSHEHLITYWHWAYVAGTFLAGAIWGSSAIFLFPDNELGHQLFVVFVLAGMNAAAVPVLAASLVAFFLFALLSLFPVIIQMFWQNSTVSTSMGMMIIFYVIGLSISALGMNRTILTSLTLRFDNRELEKQIIERQIAEEALFQQKERLQITFSAIVGGVIITSAKGVIEYLNPAAEIMSGWLNTEAKNKPVEQIFSHFDESMNEYRQSAIYQCLQNASRSKNTSLLLARDGKKRIIEEVANPLKGRNGDLIGTVAIFRDVTQASEHSRQLAYQASHDILTGLPNRSLLSDRLKHAIDKAIRANCFVAILFMDLDRFKQINDSLGHTAGDSLLRHVAERLVESVRKEDTVARLGGDEFVIVIENVISDDQALSVAQKIVENLAIPLTIESQEICVSVSIGISIFSRDGKNVETLLKNADMAMYRTKELGQGNIQFYSSELSVRALNRLKTEQQLQQAVAKDELELYYQPRVAMNSSEVIGLEALVRWRTSSNTLVSPAEFIHIAEETGSILKIGEWVLHSACEQTQYWRKNGYPNLHIAVNLSVRQIRSPNLVDQVAKVLSNTGLNPELLELEITENLFLNGAEHVIMALHELKALGVKLAIDDFGTGYSSLTYIKQFPVDILKIDRSFIQDISEKSADGAIVSAIVTMGQGLNLEVIAEGVENEVQHQYLSALGCDSFQGYYFSKPLPASTITTLLHEKISTWQTS